MSQSVEHDHPAAFEFLRKDLKNAGDFCRSYGVRYPSLRRAFDFVTSTNIEADSGTNILKRSLEAPGTKEAADESKPSALEESPCAQGNGGLGTLEEFIPQNLREVLNPEQEVERWDHRTEGNLRLGVVGAERDHTALRHGVNETSSEEGEGQSSGEDERDINAKPWRGYRYEDREAKKVRYILRHHGGH